MLVAKVGRRGQMTVPRTIRRWLNLREGDRVAFLRRGNEVLLEPLTATLRDLRGSVPVTAPQDFASVRRQIIAERARRVTKDGD